MSDRPDPKQVQKYLDQAMKVLEENPESLDKNERRMLLKVKKGSEAAQKADKDIGELKNQVTQAQARIKSLELVTENQQGYVNAYIEQLVEMKFDYEEELPSTPEPPKEPEEDPSNGNRKSRRASKATKSKTKGSAKEAQPTT